MASELVVQKQLRAYNNRNIDEFMSVMSKDIMVHDFANQKTIMKGYVACKDFYARLFENSPKLHSTILKRIVFGNTIIDHEEITGRNGHKGALEMVLIYEVKNGKIFKITVLSEQL